MFCSPVNQRTSIKLLEFECYLRITVRKHKTNSEEHERNQHFLHFEKIHSVTKVVFFIYNFPIGSNKLVQYASVFNNRKTRLSSFR